MAMKRIKQFVIASIVFLILFNVSDAQERHTEVTLKINLRAPENSEDVRLWIPYPVSDENQIIEDAWVAGKYTFQGIYREKEFGNSILYAEWKYPVKDRILTYTFKVRRKEVVRKDFPKSDVRKIMLEKKLKLGEEKKYREYYFGAVDENRISYGMGRDLILNPPQKNGKLNYLTYPYTEADGKALDDLFGFNLGYTITFKEL